MAARRAPGPANRLVVALVCDGLSLFEFGIVAEVFALRRPELGVPWYDFAVVSYDEPPLSATGGVRILPTHSVQDAGPRRHDRHPQLARPRRAAAAGDARRAARRPPPRGAADVGVLGRVRAGRRGVARRPARHHALAARQQTAGDVPGSARGTVRALCAGRQRLHRRRQRRRHRPRTAAGPSGLRLGDRQPGGAADGRAAPSRGRAVAVRGRGRGVAGRIAGADHGMGERAARSAARRVGAGAQGPDVAADAGPAVRIAGRHHAASVADAPAGAGGATAARDVERVDRARRRAVGVRHAGDAAASLPAPGRARRQSPTAAASRNPPRAPFVPSTVGPAADGADAELSAGRRRPARWSPGRGWWPGPALRSSRGRRRSPRPGDPSADRSSPPASCRPASPSAPGRRSR